MIKSFPILDFYPSSISYTGRPKSLVASDRFTGIVDMNRELYNESPLVYNIEYKDLTKTQYNKIKTFYDLVDLNTPFIFMAHYRPAVVNFIKPITKSQESYGYYNISFSVENYYGSVSAETSSNIIGNVETDEILCYEDFESVYSAVKNALSNESKVNLIRYDFGSQSGTYILEVQLHMYWGVHPRICTCVDNLVNHSNMHSLTTETLRNGYNRFELVLNNLDRYLLIYNEPNEPSKFTLNATLVP